MKEAATVPLYVDTETPTVHWYGFNSLIAVLSLLMVIVASLLLEYELAKLRSPEAGFLPTPTVLDGALAIITVLLGLANLSVLVFVFLRHLKLRKWMGSTVMIGWVLLAVLAVVLQDRFLLILFP